MCGVEFGYTGHETQKLAILTAPRLFLARVRIQTFTEYMNYSLQRSAVHTRASTIRNHLSRAPDTHHHRRVPTPPPSRRLRLFPPRPPSDIPARAYLFPPTSLGADCPEGLWRRAHRVRARATLCQRIGIEICGAPPPRGVC